MSCKNEVVKMPLVVAAVVALLLWFGPIVPAAFGQQGDIRNVHDPCIIKENDTFYIFSTAKGIPIRRSKDLLHWEKAGRVFVDDLPEWARQEIPGSEFPWAPDISFFHGEYHLYYSISTFHSQRSCIGLATNKTLDSSSKDYKWTDHGKVLESIPGNHDYNAIDPNIIIDESNQSWLCFGSFFAGIKMVRIDPGTGRPASEDRTIYPLALRPQAIAIEAPFIIKKGDYYYLFVSFDQCCQGVDSTYRIFVGRSKQIIGPYVDLNDKPLLAGGGTLVLAGYGPVQGPGHNAVLRENDNDFLVHHYYDARENGVPTLQIRPLIWGYDGFPLAGEPITETVTKPLATPDLVKQLTAGEWQHSVNFDEPIRIRFLPGGTINTADSVTTWTIKGRNLTLYWARADAPDGVWVDMCVMAADGKSYVGRNQLHAVIRGVASGK